MDSVLGSYKNRQHKSKRDSYPVSILKMRKLRLSEYVGGATHPQLAVTKRGMESQVQGHSPMLLCLSNGPCKFVIVSVSCCHITNCPPTLWVKITPLTLVVISVS